MFANILSLFILIHQLWTPVDSSNSLKKLYPACKESDLQNEIIADTSNVNIECRIPPLHAGAGNDENKRIIFYRCRLLCEAGYVIDHPDHPDRSGNENEVFSESYFVCKKVPNKTNLFYWKYVDPDSNNNDDFLGCKPSSCFPAVTLKNGASSQAWKFKKITDFSLETSKFQYGKLFLYISAIQDIFINSDFGNDGFTVIVKLSQKIKGQFFVSEAANLHGHKTGLENDSNHGNEGSSGSFKFSFTSTHHHRKIMGQDYSAFDENEFRKIKLEFNVVFYSEPGSYLPKNILISEISMLQGEYANVECLTNFNDNGLDSFAIFNGSDELVKISDNSQLYNDSGISNGYYFNPLFRVGQMGQNATNAINACSQASSMSKTPCNTGYSLKNGFCSENLCSCQDGLPSSTGSCLSDQPGGGPRDSCQSCDSNTTKVQNKCKKNFCTCKNGLAAVGENCPADRTEFCTHCHTGFVLLSDTTTYGYQTQRCVKQCVCSNGVPVPDENCPVHGGNYCSSCDQNGIDSGYDLINYKCFKNCVCLNGTPVEENHCPAHGSNYCSSCSHGYFLTGGSICEMNKCGCDNGTPVADSICSINNDNQCDSCDSGYYLYGNDCYINQCVCLNGSAVSDSSCTTNVGNQCSSCNSGYYMSGSNCYINQCVCSNGSAVSASSCTSNGSNQCSSCNSGYYKSGSTCYINQCVCSNGSAVSDSSCTSNGSNQCSSCNSGYYKSGTSCYINSCGCSNGYAVSDSSCTTNGANQCSSCYSGYYKSGTSCYINSCICSNGYSVSDSSCTTNGANQCSSCYSGYYQSGDYCYLKTCYCTNGYGTSGSSCATHNTHQCSSCYTGFAKSGNYCYMKKYFYFTGNYNFDEAVSKCLNENMAPAIMLSEDDNNAVLSEISGVDMEFWAGGQKIDFSTTHLGGFYWQDGTSLTIDPRLKISNRFQYWYPGEPNNSGDQRCLQIFRPSKSQKWDDVQCYHDRYALCQYNHCSNDQVEEVSSNNEVTCLSFTKAKKVSATYSLASGEYYASLAWVENNESAALGATTTWAILLFKKYPTRRGYTDDSESAWNPTYKQDGSGYGGDYKSGGTWTEGSERLVMYN